MLLLTILSIGLGQVDGATPEPYRAEVIRGPGLYDAPHLLQPPDDLPPAEIRDRGVWLPMRLNLALGVYRRACDLLPVAFQVQLGQLELVEVGAWTAGIKLGAARERHRHATQALDAPPLAETGLPRWLRTTLITLGAVAIAAGGFALGWLAHGG